MTVRFKNELVRNITIKLGYANAKVRFAQLHTMSTIFLTIPHTINPPSSPPMNRSTSVKTKHVPVLVAIGLTDQTRKTTHHASVQAATPA